MQPPTKPTRQSMRLQVEVDAAANSRREAMNAYVGLACQHECDGLTRMLAERFGCPRQQQPDNNTAAPTTAANAKIMQCLQAARAWKAVAQGMQVQQEWTVLLHDPMAKTRNQPVPFTITVCYSSIPQHKQTPATQPAVNARPPSSRLSGLRRARSEPAACDRNVRQRVHDDQQELDLSGHIDEAEIEMFLDEESIRLVEQQLSERDNEETLDDQELDELLSDVLS